MPTKLPFNLDSIVQHVSRLKLQGGLAGKICHVLIFVALAMALISWSVKVPLIAILALVMVFILTFVVLWRLINLADENPQSALMEGAEFLLHEQMMLGTKSNPQLLSRDKDVVEAGQLHLSQAELQALEQADQDPPKRLPPSAGSKREEA